MIELVQERRLESLLAHLAVRLGFPRDPLFPDILVVPTVGMARWVRFAVAESNEGFCHFRILPVGSFLWELFGSVLTGLPAEPLSIPALTVEIVRVLISPSKHPQLSSAGLELPSFREDPYWYYDFARRLADLYDRLTLYRPEIILAWEEGESGRWGDDIWLSRIWRLASTGFPDHRAALLRKIKASLVDSGVRERLRAQYPFPIHVFGHPLLPPVVIGLLVEVSEFLDVVVYHPSPSGEYSLYEGRRQNLSGNETFHSGNRLLRALGHQHQAMQQILLESVSQWEEDSDRGAVPASSLLSMVKEDIWYDRERPEAGDLSGEISPEDGSIRIYVCDSPLDEVERLRRTLFELMSRVPGLEPSDIVVLAPDMERYTPFVEGVFLADPPDFRIPFTLSADTPSSGLLSWFLGLLEIADSPFSALDVLSLLESEGIRHAFGFGIEDLPALDRIVRRLGILWGLDGLTRERFGSPEPYRNTFQYGRDRMLLSLARAQALPGDGAMIPLENADPDIWSLFERFLVFLDRLDTLKDKAGGTHTLDEWGMLLEGILSDFFPEEPDSPMDERERELLRECLLRFKRSGPMPEARWDLSSVRRIVEKEAGEESRDRAILTGKGVLFSNMVPVRGIPFRVVWILGMENGSFPRPDRPLSFDFLGHHPKPGDRSVWEDDNALFLDALLSAGSVFGVSYTGKNPKGAGIIPPSSPVVLLLEAIREGFGDDVATRVVQEQKPEGRPVGSGCNPDRPFWSRSPIHDIPWEGERDVSDLMEFLRSPSAYLLEHWGSVRPTRDREALPESEPFLVERRTERGLARYLSRRMGGGRFPGPEAFLESSGDLPHGTVREWEMADLKVMGNRFDELADRLGSEGLVYGPVPVSEDIRDPDRNGSIRLTGALLLWSRPSGTWSAVFPKEMLGSEWLRAWAMHLLMQRREPFGGWHGRVYCLTRSGGWTEHVLSPPEAPEAHLETLIRYYLEGGLRPLPLFSKSSLAYAGALSGKGLTLATFPLDGRTADLRRKGLEKAHKSWTGTEFEMGEGIYPEHHLLYADSSLIPHPDVLGDPRAPLAEFERLSLLFFLPIFAASDAKPETEEGT